MILLIDNYDSFTYNLSQMIAGLGFEVLVKKNDEINLDDIVALNPEKIVISPGPKRPMDAGISIDVIKQFHKKIPILGVCLGHQCIGQLFGVRVVHAKEVLHGEASEIFHNGKGIFHGVDNPFLAARYHSLALEKCPDGFEVRAKTKDGEIMAIQHMVYPLHGVQFHPESFLTENGEMLIKNFLSIKS